MIFEHKGLKFRYEIDPDDYYGPPWKEECGHGPVSDWEHRKKLPHEWVLIEDRGSYRFYDSKAALETALKDGWGPKDPALTHKQNAAAAVRRDYEYLRAWCNDEWSYVCVRVILLDVDGNDTEEEAILGGVHSDYVEDCLKELAEEILASVGDSDTLTYTQRIRPCVSER
jgi:hypothetical protein